MPNDYGYGKGIVYLEGNSPNTYSNSTVVWDGTLILNKPAGVNAIPNTIVASGSNVLVRLNANNLTLNVKNSKLRQVRYSALIFT